MSLSLPDQLHLGKRRGVVHDPRTLRFATYAKKAELRRAVPRRVNHSRAVQGGFPLFANDRYGDCTCASQGHRILLQERNSRQQEIKVTDQDVLAVYAAVTGFDPSRPETDNGAYLLDVLNYLRKNGLGREKDGTPHTLSAFVKLDHGRLDEVRLASWMFGGLYLGVLLPISAQQQDIWDVTDTKDSEPGSWGGHAIWMTGYDTRHVHFVTWGEHRKMTWKFFAGYVDEAYATISEDFLRAGKTARGFNVDALNGYLAELG